MPNRILISACLAGEPVRYNGTDRLLDHPILRRWKQEGRLVLVCPEVLGGLPVPRPPAEITGGDGTAVLQGLATVLTNAGHDVTAAFVSGARQTLTLVFQQAITVAILTENSPSCGSTTIYTGRFDGTKRIGEGVTTALLRQHHILVFSQNQIDAVMDYVQQRDQGER